MPKEDELIKVGLVIGGLVLLSRVSASAQASAAPLQTGQTYGTIVGQTVSNLIAGSGSYSPDLIRSVQAQLNSVLGTNLDVDGVLGPATKSAIMTFQSLVNLPATGNPDSVTVGFLWEALPAELTGGGGAGVPDIGL